MGNVEKGEEKVKLIKIFGLAAFAALAAMAFVGASSATAESTNLCTNHTGTCSVPSSVHFLTVKVTLHTPGGVELSVDEKGTLLNNTLTVRCDGLLSGTVLGTGATIDVTATELVYTNCTSGCTATSLNAGVLTVLRLVGGVELADVTGTGFEVRVNCLGIFDCYYNAAGLVGHGLGPLNGDTLQNGHVTYSENVVNLVKGIGCPAVAKLDALFQSLTPVYIR